MDAFFDMFAGISGNMVLGALLDLGLAQAELEENLAKLGLDTEYSLETKTVVKNGISATYVKVELKEDHHEKDHHHHHHHHHSRNLNDIKKIIENSTLKKSIQEKSIAIFTNLAKAEAKIHQKTIDEIHFHEVGAVDAIVDIVGTVIGLDLLKIDKIYASKVHVGSGFIHCDHGKLPIPAPATMELLQDVPIYDTGIKEELVTPTGAAIIITLANSFGLRPEMELKKTAYGAGTRDLEIPNLLRVNLGEIRKKKELKLIETNIDDMNPEFYEYIMERLFKIGALDVYFTPIQMKKNRPAIKLSVLIKEDILDETLDVLVKETTSLGFRIMTGVERYCLERETKKINTPWGQVRVKLAQKEGEVVNIAPEYEDCKEIAKKNLISLKQVYQYIQSRFKDKEL